MDVLGPQFAFHQDREVGLDGFPGTGAEGPEIKGENAPPGSQPPVITGHQGIPGTRGCGEDDLGPRFITESLQKGTDGIELADTHGLNPNSFDSRKLRGNVAENSEPIPEALLVSAPAPHPVEVMRKHQEECRDKQDAIEEYHR